MQKRHEHIMVCVTGQRNCERLILSSAQLAKTLAEQEAADDTRDVKSTRSMKKIPVSVIHVATGTNHFMGCEDEGAALEYLFQISKNHDAQMSVMRSVNVVETIAAFAEKHNVTHAVMGVSLYAQDPDIVGELKKRLPGVSFLTIPYDAASVAVNM